MTSVYDLRIAGGTVFDASQNLAAQADVLVQDSRVAAVGEDLAGEARQTLDASGRYVTPGLVDLHMHAYWGVSHYGIDADEGCLPRGVTTAIDAGSSGAITFPGLRRYVIERQRTRLYAFLHIAAAGMFSRDVGESADERLLDVDRAIETINANRDVIVGIKIRQTDRLVGSLGSRPLRDAIRAAEATGLPVMLHIGNTPVPLEELLSMLRTGDIVTHSFRGAVGDGLLGPDERVRPAVLEARERGVRFDIGHGSGSFSFDSAEQLVAQGFLPDTISSDLHIYSLPGPVYDLANVLSKFLFLGLSLEQVFARATLAPTQAVALADGIGTLGTGAPADIAIWELRDEAVTFMDSLGRTRQGSRQLEPVAVIREGEVVRSALA
ncbi:MAG: amidohydrolase/deacetylase family metallohydrolase [Dehalococcoidia bacterium]|nr:amidohydrolase/deacetylase family metallohydrolase [Dehalococcoidia bacterium]